MRRSLTTGRYGIYSIPESDETKAPSSMAPPLLDHSFRPRVRRRSRTQALASLVLLAVAIYILYLLFRKPREKNPYELFGPYKPPFGGNRPKHHVSPECAHLAGIEDIFVIMKTGATELPRKLPVHFESTFRCVPESNYRIFSDMHDTFEGRQIYDSFDEYSEETKSQYKEFEVYKKLQAYKRGDVNLEGWTPDKVNYQEAWNLDKWKFLPLLDKAMRLKPEAKWFIFMEADTYFMWSNVLKFLQQFDWQGSHYVGGQSWIRDQEFAHGGSGFMISNGALRKVTDARRRDIPKYDALTAREWAGDAVVAFAMKDVDVHVLRGWPLFQRESPSSLDYRRPPVYCYPVLSYHHLSTEEVRTLADFERYWVSVKHNHPILHADVFTGVVFPEMAKEIPGNYKGERFEWNNMEDDWGTPKEWQYTIDVSSLKACRTACYGRSDCLQYRFVNKKCYMSSNMRLGGDAAFKKEGSTSGWSLKKIQEMQAKMEPCKPNWQPWKNV